MFRSSLITAAALAAISASLWLGTAATAAAATSQTAPAASPAATSVWNRPFYADPQTPAAQVAASQPSNTVAAAIAKVPQARWFTPDNSVSTIRAAVAQYVAGAAATNTIPVLVTY